MVTADLLYEEDLDYSVSFRQVRRDETGGPPPPGRFETTGRAKLASASRHRRQGSGTTGGIQRRKTVRAVR